MCEICARELQLRQALAEASQRIEALTAELDKAWGELGFTRNDLGNALYRAEAAEAKVEALTAERDEMKRGLAMHAINCPQCHAAVLSAIRVPKVAHGS